MAQGWARHGLRGGPKGVAELATLLCLALCMVLTPPPPITLLPALPRRGGTCFALAFEAFLSNIYHDYPHPSSHQIPKSKNLSNPRASYLSSDEGQNFSALETISRG